jgi:hypothetical protein
MPDTALRRTVCAFEFAGAPVKHIREVRSPVKLRSRQAG